MRHLMLAAFLVLLSGLNLLAGDLTITSHITGKGPLAKDGDQVQYIDATRMRVNHRGTQTDTMIDYGRGVMYVINHDKKTISRLTFQELQATMDAMNEKMGAVSDLMGKMMFGNPSEVKVVKEGTDSVLGRPCQKVRITVGKMVEDLSIDPTLQFPIRDYAKTMARMSQAPGAMGTVFKRLYEEVGKLHGVPLRTHVRGFMGLDMTTEATAITTAPIPANAWALPVGYQEVDRTKEMQESAKGRH